MSFENDEYTTPGANIKVIGIGGGGCNAVNTMIRENIEGVQFINANTDVQSLRGALSNTKLQIGKELTRGLGAGADPDIGRDAALEDRHELSESISGSDMVFIAAGMGGGTGTGGAPVIAQLAKDSGALTVGVVTKPFHFEGKRRRRFAELGIQRLKEYVDTLIVVPNEKLISMAQEDLTMIDAFKMADSVLVNAVKGITEVINVSGNMNLDFADVKTVMSGMGHALMGIGTASGPDRAVDAAMAAIKSPLLEDIDIEGATGILVNITAGTSLGIMELSKAANIVKEAAHEEATIISGTVIDESMGDELRVTVIATGFPVESELIDDPLAPSGFKNKAVQRTRPAKPAQNAAPVPRRQETSLPESMRQGATNQVAREEPSPELPIELQEEIKPIVHEPVEKPTMTQEFAQNLVTEVEESSLLEHEALTDLTFKGTESSLTPKGELNLDHLANDIEKSIDDTIDEAIKLTSEVSEIDEMDESDEVHVPAFLRETTKSL